jgi:hypothetical protein
MSKKSSRTVKRSDSSVKPWVRWLALAMGLLMLLGTVAGVLTGMFM